MKKIFLMLAAVIATIVAATAQDVQNYPFVQVSGHAEKEFEPDRFILMITVDEQDSKGKLTVENRQREMIAALKSLGVDTDAKLKMANMASAYYKRQTSLTVARYQLELGSADMVARVIARLSDMGISNVVIQNVTHSQIEQFKQEVRIAAIRNAREVAESLAAAIGQRIGRCIYIYDPNRDAAPYVNTMLTRNAKYAYDMAVEESADTGGGQPEFKTIKLEYDVQAKFHLPQE